MAEKEVKAFEEKAKEKNNEVSKIDWARSGIQEFRWKDVSEYKGKAK